MRRRMILCLDDEEFWFETSDQREVDGGNPKKPNNSDHGYDESGNKADDEYSSDDDYDLNQLAQKSKSEKNKQKKYSKNGDGKMKQNKNKETGKINDNDLNVSLRTIQMHNVMHHLNKRVTYKYCLQIHTTER